MYLKTHVFFRWTPFITCGIPSILQRLTAGHEQSPRKQVRRQMLAMSCFLFNTFSHYFWLVAYNYIKSHQWWSVRQEQEAQQSISPAIFGWTAWLMAISGCPTSCACFFPPKRFSKHRQERALGTGNLQTHLAFLPRESHPHDSKAPTEKQPQQSVHVLGGGRFFVGPRQFGALRKKEEVVEEVGEWGDNGDDSHLSVILSLSHFLWLCWFLSYHHIIISII